MRLRRGLLVNAPAALLEQHRRRITEPGERHPGDQEELEAVKQEKGSLLPKESVVLPRAAIFLRGGGVQDSAGIRPSLAGEALIQYEKMFTEQAIHDEREAAKFRQGFVRQSSRSLCKRPFRCDLQFPGSLPLRTLTEFFIWSVHRVNELMRKSLNKGRGSAAHAVEMQIPALAKNLVGTGSELSLGVGFSNSLVALG